MSSRAASFYTSMCESLIFDQISSAIAKISLGVFSFFESDEMLTALIASIYLVFGLYNERRQCLFVNVVIIVTGLKPLQNVTRPLGPSKGPLSLSAAGV